VCKHLTVYQRTPNFWCVIAASNVGTRAI
jgi:hypothetical protein